MAGIFSYSFSGTCASACTDTNVWVVSDTTTTTTATNIEFIDQYRYDYLAVVRDDVFSEEEMAIIEHKARMKELNNCQNRDNFLIKPLWGYPKQHLYFKCLKRGNIGFKNLFSKSGYLPARIRRKRK